MRSKKRIINRMLGIFLPALFVVGCLHLSNFTYAETETEKKLSQTQEEINALKEEQASLAKELSEYEDDVEGISEKIENLEAQSEAKQEEIELLKEQIETLEEQKASQYDLMKSRVKYTYENGGMGSYITLLLESKSFSQLLTRAEYIVQVREYDQNLLDEYTDTCVALNEQEEALDAELAELEELTAQSKSAQEELTEKIAETKENISDSEEDLAAKMEEAEALQEQIEQESLAAAQAAAEAAAQKAQEEAEAAAQEASKEETTEEESDEAESSNDSSDSSETTSASYSAAAGDLELMSAIIYCEAGGESYEGMLAVGSVVMNRVDSSAYPNTVSGVIYQSGQFSPVASGKFALVLNNQSWNSSSQSAAQEVLNGKRTVSYLHFHSASGWTSDAGEVIGNQVFY